MKPKRLLALSSAAAVAVSGTAICYSPKTEVKAHAADFGGLVAAADYILAAGGSEAAALSSVPVAGWIVAAAVVGVVAYNALQTEPNLNLHLGLSTVSGTYYDLGGTQKILVAFVYHDDNSVWYNPTSGDVWLPLLRSSDINVELSVPTGREFNMLYSSGSGAYLATGNPGGSVRGTGTLLAGELGYLGWNDSRKISPVYSTSVPYLDTHIENYFRWAGSSQYTSPIMYGDDTGYALPGNTSLLYSDPNAYIESELRPYVQTNYPEYIYLLPDKPYEPEYPTDFVTGIPKDWTITNPQLPTMPNLSLDIPDSTLPSMDVSSELGQYTDGVRFWWALTGWVMDTLGIKTLVIVFLIIGIAVFALFKIGG